MRDWVHTFFAGYERTFSEGQDREEYDRLLKSASQTEILEKNGSDEQAYFDAGKRMVDLSELLVAVWDGKPAAGLGGTGDVMQYAIRSKKRAIHLNPITRELLLSV
jgi:hypothetical protein